MYVPCEKNSFVTLHTLYYGINFYLYIVYFIKYYIHKLINYKMYNN